MKKARVFFLVMTSGITNKNNLAGSSKAHDSETFIRRHIAWLKNIERAHAFIVSFPLTQTGALQVLRALTLSVITSVAIHSKSVLSTPFINHNLEQWESALSTTDLADRVTLMEREE